MLSSVGRVRSGNEDFCAASPEHGIFVVCDGMGGAAAGEVASQLAGTTFVQYVQHLDLTSSPGGDITPLLEAAALAANDAVYSHAQRTAGTRGMGTTLVALVAPPAAAPEKLWLVHVGDSRCYRMRAGTLTQLTEDHSLVQEQIRAGTMTAAEAEHSPVRNIITRAIGAQSGVEPEVAALAALPGDLYLLASDGLTRELSGARIAGHLASAPAELDRTCNALIEAANAAGGHDNITVLLLRIP